MLSCHAGIQAGAACARARARIDTYTHTSRQALTLSICISGASLTVTTLPLVRASSLLWMVDLGSFKTLTHSLTMRSGYAYEFLATSLTKQNLTEAAIGGGNTMTTV